MTLVTYCLTRMIRPARPEDRDRVIQIANQAFTPKDKTGWIIDAFQRKDRTIILYECLGIVIGFVITRVDGDVLVIDLIGTTHPRQGIGRILIAVAQAMAPEQCRTVRAGTYIENETARNFYQALGFQEC